jgi:hypothetical protein
VLAWLEGREEESVSRGGNCMGVDEWDVIFRDEAE